MKRRSMRHVSEITAIASEYGNSAKIVVPRSWLGRRVIAFLHWNISQNIQRSEKQLSSDPLLPSIIPFACSIIHLSRYIPDFLAFVICYYFMFNPSNIKVVVTHL